MKLLSLLFAISLVSVASAEDEGEGQCPTLTTINKSQKNWSFRPDLDRHNPVLVKMATCNIHPSETDTGLNIALTHVCTGIEKHLGDNCTAVTRDAIDQTKPHDFCEFNWEGRKFKPWTASYLMKQIAGPTGQEFGYVNIAPGGWQILENWSLRVAVNSRSQGARQINIRGIDAIQLFNAYVFPPLWIVAKEPLSSSPTGLFIKRGIVGATQGHGFVLGPGAAIVVNGNREYRCYDNIRCARKFRDQTSFLVANRNVLLGAKSKLMVVGPYSSLVLNSTNGKDIVIPSNVTVCVCHGDENPEKYGGYGPIVLNSDAIKDLTPGWNYLFNMPNVAAYSTKPDGIKRGRFDPASGRKDDPFVDRDLRKYNEKDYSLFIRYTGENPPTGFENCCLGLIRGEARENVQDASGMIVNTGAGFQDIMSAARVHKKNSFDATSCPAHKLPTAIPPSMTDPIPRTTTPKTEPTTEEVKTSPSTSSYLSSTQPPPTSTTQKPSRPAWVIPVSVVLSLFAVGCFIAAFMLYKRCTGESQALSMEHNPEMKDQPSTNGVGGSTRGSEKEPVVAEVISNE